MPLVSFNPIYINRFMTGLNTQRSPLVTPFSFAGLQRIERLDALWDGLNVDVSNAQTLQRRAGFSKYSSAQLGASDIPRRFFAWKKLDKSVVLLVDLEAHVSKFDSTSITSIHTPSDTTKPWSFRGVGDMLYAANGSETFKWDGTTKTNWGIAAPVTEPTIGVADNASGLTPTSGYRWVYVFKNSSTGHVSTASSASASTGSFSTAKQFTISGEDTADTQVDKVEIYRIKDGGSVFYYVAQIDYVSGWSYVDTTTDDNLDVEKTAPLNHLNDPPPSGLTNVVFHTGRMWGSSGQYVYFSSGPDVLNGVPEESWHPNNFFTFPNEVTALVPTNNGLLVFTSTDAYIIRGIDSSSYYSQPWMAGFGVLTNTAVVTDGDSVLVFTSQGELVMIGSSLTTLSFPIGDKFATYIDPATAYVTIHRTPNETSIYLSSSNGYILRFSLTTQSWSAPWQMAGGNALALTSLESSNGSFTLFAGRAAGSGYVLKRDTDVFSDDGVAYSAWAIIGSIVLTPPGDIAPVESLMIERQAVGSEFTISILPNEISGSFTTLPTAVAEPPELPATTTVIANRYYLKSATSALPEIMRHLQIKIDMGQDSAKNELLGLAIAPRA